MSAESSVHADPLPYVDALAARPVDSIDLVVIHCTELPDLATARRFGERIQYDQSRTGNSGQGYSLASSNYPSKYIRHYNFSVYVASNGGSNTWDAATSWAADTSWLAAEGLG